MSTSYHHADLRAGLIEAGLKLLREGGVAALTLRAAARAANVSAMAPYRHFTDKEALLGAIAAQGFERLRAALSEADQATKAIDALRAQGVAYVAFATTEPALFRLMFGSERSRVDPAPQASGKAFAVLENRVATLAPPEERQTLTLACWSLVHGLAALIVDGQIEDAAAPSEIARAVTTMMTRLFG